MSEIKFSKSHEWVDTSSEEMIVGITDHAQSLLGDMVYVELPEVGKEVAVGDEIGVLESVKAASDLYAPISGKIVAINQEVVDSPSLLNTDPSGQGWLIKIKAASTEKLAAELEDLVLEDEYLSDLAEEV